MISNGAFQPLALARRASSPAVPRAGAGRAAEFRGIANMVCEFHWGQPHGVVIFCGFPFPPTPKRGGALQSANPNKTGASTHLSIMSLPFGA